MRFGEMFLHIALKRVISRIFLMISNQKDIDLVFYRDEINVRYL